VQPGCVNCKRALQNDWSVWAFSRTLISPSCTVPSSADFMPVKYATHQNTNTSKLQKIYNLKVTLKWNSGVYQKVCNARRGKTFNSLMNKYSLTYYCSLQQYETRQISFKWSKRDIRNLNNLCFFSSSVNQSSNQSVTFYSGLGNKNYFKVHCFVLTTVRSLEQKDLQADARTSRWITLKQYCQAAHSTSWWR